MNNLYLYNDVKIEGLTPSTADNDSEVMMSLTDEDMDKIGRGREWSAIVKDQNTNRTFEVTGAPCNISTCFCAARIVREIAGETTNLRWQNNAIQFPRLIAEIDMAGGFTDEVLESLCESMDLTLEDITELISRATNEFDRIKTTLP